MVVVSVAGLYSARSRTVPKWSVRGRRTSPSVVRFSIDSSAKIWSTAVGFQK